MIDFTEVQCTVIWGSFILCKVSLTFIKTYFTITSLSRSPPPPHASLEAVNIPQLSPGPSLRSQSASTLLCTPLPSLPTCCLLPKAFQTPRPMSSGDFCTPGQPLRLAPSSLPLRSQALALSPQDAGPLWLSSGRGAPWLGGLQPLRLLGCHSVLGTSLSRRSPWPARYETF